MPDPGFMRLFGTLIERYGNDAVKAAPMDASTEVGPESGVLTLHVAQDQLDEASRLCAELAVAVEEAFHERYTVLVVAKDPEADA